MSTGAVASYTPVTSEITSVDVAPAWNQSQEWSTYGTATGVAFKSTDPLSKSFDGNLNSGGAQADGLGNSTFTFSAPIPYSESLVIYYSASRFSTGIVLVNGVNIVEGWGQNVSSGSGIKTITGSGTLDSFQVQNTVDDNPNLIYGFVVDGKILTDTGITGDPGAGTSSPSTPPTQTFSSSALAITLVQVVALHRSSTQVTALTQEQSLVLGFSPDWCG